MLKGVRWGLSAPAGPRRKLPPPCADEENSNPKNLSRFCFEQHSLDVLQVGSADLKKYQGLDLPNSCEASWVHCQSSAPAETKLSEGRPHKGRAEMPQPFFWSQEHILFKRPRCLFTARIMQRSPDFYSNGPDFYEGAPQRAVLVAGASAMQAPVVGIPAYLPAHAVAHTSSSMHGATQRACTSTGSYAAGPLPIYTVIYIYIYIYYVCVCVCMYIYIYIYIYTYTHM